MPTLTQLSDRLAALSAEHRLRVRRDVASPCGVRVTVAGQTCLAFASNDYLGLAQHPALIASAQAAASEWGVGAGASHLVSGHTTAHSELEAALAAFVGCEAALSFSTGYMANIAVMPALLDRHGEIFADRLNHASLIDGALLARATVSRYRHNDMAALRQALEASRASNKLIVTDAVFSMDGDEAPLTELLALAEQFDAWLLIDDAHGFGVLGPQGRGSVAAAKLQSARLIYMATLGKAAGVAGAFVAGSQQLMDYLLNTARSYIFTTAMPPAQAVVLQRAIELIADADAARAHLQSLIQQLQIGLAGYPLLTSHTAIQPFVVGENAATQALTQRLWALGLWVPAIRPPTVAPGSARLRISLSAAHQTSDVAELISALKNNFSI